MAGAWTFFLDRREPNYLRLMACGGGEEIYVDVFDGFTAGGAVAILRELADGIEKKTTGTTLTERRAEFTKGLLAKAFGDDIDLMAAYVTGSR